MRVVENFRDLYIIKFFSVLYVGNALKLKRIFDRHKLKDFLIIAKKNPHSNQYCNKQLLDEVFVICGIIKVEVLSGEPKARRIYRYFDNCADHKNRVQYM